MKTWQAISIPLLILFILVPSLVSGEGNQSYQSLYLDGFLPDLKVTDLVIDGNVSTGKDISGTVLVINRGPVPADDVSIQFLLKGTDKIEKTVIWLSVKATEQIPANYQAIMPFAFPVPMGLEEGQYLLEVGITSRQPDYNPVDNSVKSGPVLITRGTPWRGGKPDLTVSIDSLDRNHTASGYPLHITYTVKNQNNDSAGSYYTGFFLSRDEYVSADDYRVREAVSYSVYGDMTLEGVSQGLVPDTIPSGRYYLYAVVDYTGMILEVDETNNIFFYPEPIDILVSDNLYSDEYSAIISGYIFLKTNKYREYLGLTPLSYDASLSEISYDHSLDMIKRQYFSHYTPEGFDPDTRARLAGYNTVKQMADGSIRTGIAENIVKIGAGHTFGKAYIGFVDPSTPEGIADIMMIEWINSPEHNKNLINPSVDRIGVGTLFDGEYFYATQNFY